MCYNYGTIQIQRSLPPAEVTFPPLTPAELILDLATLQGCRGCVNPVGWLHTEIVYPPIPILAGPDGRTTLTTTPRRQFPRYARGQTDTQIDMLIAILLSLPGAE